MSGSDGESTIACDALHLVLVDLHGAWCCAQADSLARLGLVNGYKAGSTCAGSQGAIEIDIISCDCHSIVRCSESLVCRRDNQ